MSTTPKRPSRCRLCVLVDETPTGVKMPASEQYWQCLADASDCDCPCAAREAGR